jgi:hypothetical protein
MFWRRSAEADAAPASTTPPSAVPDSHDGATGKGRPTPTRKEAEAARKARAKPALTKKQARQAERERMRAARDQQLTAMKTGDERHFLARDQGPVRRFVRDYVDSRRFITEFFLPIVLVVLLVSLVPNLQLQRYVTIAWLTLLLLVVAEMIYLGFRLKREVRTRFPEDTGRGHVFYGVMRATQLRRLRLPRPMVSPGSPVR